MHGHMNAKKIFIIYLFHFYYSLETKCDIKRKIQQDCPRRFVRLLEFVQNERRGAMELQIRTAPSAMGTKNMAFRFHTNSFPNSKRLKPTLRHCYHLKRRHNTKVSSKCKVRDISVMQSTKQMASTPPTPPRTSVIRRQIITINDCRAYLLAISGPPTVCITRCLFNLNSAANF